MNSNSITNRTPIVIAISIFLFGQVILFFLNVDTLIQISTIIILLALVIGSGLRYEIYIFFIRIVTPISVGLFSALLYKYIYSFNFAFDFLEASHRIATHVEWFFSFVSILYAVTTAFLLWKGLTDHDLLRHALNDEANRIRSIMNYTHYFDQEGNKNVYQITKMRENLAKYIDNIIDRNIVQNNRANDDIVKDNIYLVSEIDIEDSNDNIALEEIMKQVSELSAIRTKRRNYLENKMSPYLLFAMIVMSLSIIYPFFTERPSEGGSASYTMIVILSTLLSFMYITMVDISTPFAGFWKIKTDSLSEVREELRQHIESPPERA